MKKYFLVLIVLALAGADGFAQPTPNGDEFIWETSYLYMPYDAEFTQDDKYLVSTDDTKIVIIDAQNGEIIREKELNWNCYDIVLANNDSVIICTGTDTYVKFLDFNSLEVLNEILRFKPDEPKVTGNEFIDIANDNNLLAINWQNKGIIFYDIAKDSVLFEEKVDDLWEGGWPYRKVQFFDEDRKLALAYDKVIRIFDANTFEQIQRIGGHPNSHDSFIEDFDISPDETKIATCANDSKIIIWDFKSGEKIDEIIVDESPNITSVLLFNNNNEIIYGGGGGINTTILNINSKRVIYKNQSIESYSGLKRLNGRKDAFLTIEGRSVLLVDYNILNFGDSPENEIEQIFPNPSGEEIIIRLANNTPGDFEYKIYNYSGALVKEGALGYFGPGKIQIPLSIVGLSNGSYIIKVLSGLTSRSFYFVKGG